MDTRQDEEQTRGLLQPTPEYLASVKVFPLIPNLRRDVMVCPNLDGISKNEIFNVGFW